MNGGYFRLPENAKRGTCRSCQQPIAWVQTASGARMPLDLATAGAARRRDDGAESLRDLLPAGRSLVEEKRARDEHNTGRLLFRPRSAQSSLRRHDASDG